MPIDIAFAILSDFCYTNRKNGSSMEYDKRITIRLSQRELDKLQKKADDKGITLSEYIRKRLAKIKA